jgi:chromosomal replication initiation ATPase DnaA
MLCASTAETESAFKSRRAAPAAPAALRARAVVESAISAAFAVPTAEIGRATRGQAQIAFARQSAMYLAHVALGFTLSDVGRAFGRDRTTAAHACRRVEERREDPQVDAALAALEHTIRNACGAVRQVQS